MEDGRARSPSKPKATGKALVVFVDSPESELPCGKDWPRRPTLQKRKNWLFISPCSSVLVRVRPC